MGLSDHEILEIALFVSRAPLSKEIILLGKCLNEIIRLKEIIEKKGPIEIQTLKDNDDFNEGEVP